MLKLTYTLLLPLAFCLLQPRYITRLTAKEIWETGSKTDLEQ